MDAPYSDNQTSAEAVCFTAGPAGAPFAAGAIHAWLMSDRVPPAVIAGVSMGSLSAAAMQRCYAELSRSKACGEEREAVRWSWFRRYLSDLSDRPWDVIWKAVPDPIDYFATTAPVKDSSCPEELAEYERAARYHLFQLTKAGVWIAGIPVTAGSVARLAISYVRMKERIPVRFLGGGKLAAFWRGAKVFLHGAWLLLVVTQYTVWHPHMIYTWDRFRRFDLGEVSTKLRFSPLFGWTLWSIVSAVYFLLLPSVIIILIWLLFLGYWGWGLTTVGLLGWIGWRYCREKSVIELLNGIACSSRPGLPGPLSTLITGALKNAGIGDSIAHSYQLRRRLWNLFYDPAPVPLKTIPKDGESGAHLLIVATTLQDIPPDPADAQVKTRDISKINRQTWARPGTVIVEALTTALSVPGIFAPTSISGKDLEHWFPSSVRECSEFPSGIDLVDGSVIRRNPLPALFSWLHLPTNRDVAKNLCSEYSEDCRVHVVYSVPIEPFDPPDFPKNAARIDLVEAAQAGFMMRSQRDTKLEVFHTNSLSTLALHLSRGASAPSDPGKLLLPIFVDQIAPETIQKLGNNIDPAKFFGSVAQGCRRTLEALHRPLLKARQHEVISCYDLLTINKSNRTATVSPEHPGLPEVCRHCRDRTLRYQEPPGEIPKGVTRTYGGEKGSDPNKVLPTLLHRLCREGPRIVFVASGGVFSGSFHIGLIGAMLAAGLKPDLIVGASVGTLMGGALAAIMNVKEEESLHILADLACTFLHVDAHVALTSSLKNAIKQLGLRARALKLSPAKVRTLVRSGTAGDAGYAATGVPPEVIDTISRLFLIPPKETINIASSFLAGSFAEAFERFLGRLRCRTLPHLDVQYSVIGASLLEGVAARLMGHGLGKIDFNKIQPYPETHIFCTTSFVNRRVALVLGRDSLYDHNYSYSFLHAALSSSAFPAAFSVRSESEVLPGQGSTTNLFSDGGMYDNLPLFPAIHLLRDTQAAWLAKQNSESPAQRSSVQFLKSKLKKPDLILCGAFDAPAGKVTKPLHTMADIVRRARMLASTVKTDSFVESSTIVHSALEDLVSMYSTQTVPADTADFMNRSVVAGVINVCPTSAEHVNPAFSFSSTLGLRQDRVAASIADGCFNTFSSLLNDSTRVRSEPVRLALNALPVRILVRTSTAAAGQCPYFSMSREDEQWRPRDIPCPFQRASEVLASKAKASKERADVQLRDASALVFRICGQDPTHKRSIERATPTP